MKRFLLFILLISFIGYSQNPIQTNHPSFNDGLPQSFQSEMIVEDSDYDLNLYHSKGTRIRIVNRKLDTDYIGSFELEFDNGNIISDKSEVWDFDSGSSIPDFKQEYTYNEHGKIILLLKDSWNTDTQSYDPDFKQEYTYNEHGKIILLLKDSWNTESQSFVPRSKYEYTYDEFGNIVLLLSFNWNNETESFDLPKSQIDSVYDENQRLILRTTKRNWDSNNQLWDFRKTIDYVWDENDKNTLVTQKFWDLESNSYILSHKTIRTFSNFSQNFIFESSTIHSWNEELNIFEPTFKIIVSTTLDSEDKLHRTGTISKYNIESDNWDEIDSRFFKYTKTLSLSTNSVEPNSFSIYPNPTSNSLHINSSESLSNPLFELYDVKGSKILSSPFKLTEPIDVSGLQPSMYIYNVKDGGEVKQSGKVLIE
jgi:hypothetical protein